MARPRKPTDLIRDVQIQTQCRRPFRDWSRSVAKAGGESLASMVIRLIVAEGIRRGMGPAPER